MTLDARNTLPTFEVCFQNWLDSQTDDDLREAYQVGSDLLEARCGEELNKRLRQRSNHLLFHLHPNPDKRQSCLFERGWLNLFARAEKPHIV